MSRRSPSGPARSSFRVRLATSAGALIVGLVLVEAVLAVLGRFDPRPPVLAGEKDVVHPADADPDLGWRPPRSATVRAEPPHGDFSVTYRTNAQGFRADEDFEVVEGARRVAFLGDSFTFGVGVEYADTFVARLERALPRARCFDFGVPGFGVGQMVLTLEHCAAAVRPDLVVLTFVENDLDRSLDASRYRGDWVAKPAFHLDGDRLVPGPLDPGPLRFLVRRSRLLEAWRRGVRSLARRWPVGYRWRLNRALLERVRDDCRAAGVPLLVVHASRRPMPVLTDELERLGIPFVDLAPSWPEDDSALYYPTDPHWTPAGHAFVAERLLPAVRELLPPP